MEIYRYNKVCGCARCRCHGLMGPVVVLTVGFLLLLETLNVPHLDFGRTWPLILIAVGVTMFLKRNASVEGHAQPSWTAQYSVPPYPNAAPPPADGPAAPPSEVDHG